MVSLTALWLPIVLSAVAVFIASSIIHMALGYHNNDYTKLPDEANVVEAMRGAGVQPGMYAFPHAPSHKEMGSPEMIEKYNKGPVGLMVVMPSGPPAMGKSLVLWFVHSVIVSVFVAYICAHSLAAGTHYLGVFRIAGSAAFLAYGLAYVTDSIWKGERWATSFKNVFDGLVYGLVTAGVFGWLWP